MSATASTRMRITGTSHRPPPTVIALSALFGLFAVGTLQGGLAMIRDPHEPLGMSTGFLDRSGFDGDARTHAVNVDKRLPESARPRAES